MTQSTPTRRWADVGTEFITKAYAEDTRGRILDMERVRADIAEQIAGLRWVPPVGTMPMSPALTLQAIVDELAIPNVQQVAYNGYLALPDGPETGAYSILGIDARYSNGRVVAYYLDAGVGAYCLAIDEYLD